MSDLKDVKELIDFVAKCKSNSEAARRMGISKQALSQRLIRLGITKLHIGNYRELKRL